MGIPSHPVRLISTNINRAKPSPFTLQTTLQLPPSIPLKENHLIHDIFQKLMMNKQEGEVREIGARTNDKTTYPISFHMCVLCVLL